MLTLSAISLVVVALVSVAMYRLAVDENQDRKDALAAATTTSTTSPGFNPYVDPTLPTTLLPSTTSTTTPQSTTTTLPNGPEGEIWSAAHLAARYNVDTSGMQQSAYEKATQTAVDLLKVRTSGVGEERYPDFFANNAGMPLIDNLVIDGVYAQPAPTDGRYVRTTIWWHGTKHYSRDEVRQARTVVFLAPGTLAPVGYRQLPDDNMRADPAIDTIYVDSALGT